MPAKLKIETEFVKWRIESEDLRLLRTLHGKNVNGFARALIHVYCERQRAILAGKVVKGSEGSHS